MSWLPSGSTLQKFLCFQLIFFFVLAIVCGYFANAGAGSRSFFYNSLRGLSLKYYTQFTPVNVVFRIIWPIIYVWNLAGVVYILVSFFLPEHKSPIHVQPTLISNSFLVSYCVALISMIGWHFAFDRQLMGLSYALLIFATGAVYTALGISTKRVYDNSIYLESKDLRMMLWLVRILIHNGLGIMATWLTAASCYNMAILIIYENSFGFDPAIQRGPKLDIEDGSSVVFAFFFALIILWYTLDHVVFENYTRYIFGVFPVLILTSAGQVANLQTYATYRNFVFAVCILAFCCFSLFFRIVFFICCLRARRKAN